MRIILFHVVLAVLVALFLIYGFKKINQDREGSLEFNSERVGINRNDREDLELPLFDFKTIANATGGAGYIGSWLVKKLLDKGYIVHATLRSLDDTIKVGLLTSLPNADNGLVLFKADIYNPTEFEAAIEGCHFLFHVATPMLHTHNSQFKLCKVRSVQFGQKGIPYINT